MISTSLRQTQEWIILLNPWRVLIAWKQWLGKRVKTPTLLQMEAVECGAAALGIILGYYGSFIPLPELRQACGVSRDGSKASNMVKAARNYGMEAKGFKKSLEQVQKLDPPYIIFWNFNHFVVVEGFQRGRVYLNDPATGRRSVSFQEFDEGYTGILLVMKPAVGFKKDNRKPNTFLSLWERLKGASGALIYCIITGFLLTLVSLLLPVFDQVFVDEILIQGRELWLRPLLWGMGITVIVQSILTLLQLYYLRRLKVKLSIGMSSRFFWHILRLPVNFYAQRYAGEISDRTKLNDEVADALSGRLATTVIDSVMLIFYAAVMFYYDRILTLILISFAAINVLMLQAMSRQRVDANQRLMQDYGKVGGVTVATLQAIETIKASGLEGDAFARWSGHYTKALNSQQELAITSKILAVLPSLLSGIASILVLVIGGLRVMQGHLSIGMLIAFQALMQSFMQPVNNLVLFGTTLQELEGNLARLDDVLRNPIDPQVNSSVGGESLPLQRNHSLDNTNVFYATPRLRGFVELKNVTFGYSQVDPALINNFTLSINPGQRIAIVGGSGSGKSTISKLISGLYEPWSGEICFDGQPRKEIQRQVLTNSISVVEQDILLFGGTIRDNLTLWDTTVPEKNLRQACQDAMINEVIQSLNGGYEAELLEDAANLSGGQRQRLELARALVNNPSILILDEATSALDATTEQMIDHNLRRRGCTCIIVAHRLSTIRDCDEIIVLEKGQVVQRGTHEHLWSVDGVYSRLIRTEGGGLT